MRSIFSLVRARGEATGECNRGGAKLKMSVFRRGPSKWVLGRHESDGWMKEWSR